MKIYTLEELLDDGCSDDTKVYSAFEVETKLNELKKLIDESVSTRIIVSDNQSQNRRLGHNPSWIKAQDIHKFLESIK